ncbi:MAG: peptide chain release factor 2 [Candidatus Zambryskibacteria bacterium CG_4_9_14_3_um_filter_40_16]|uniref:Peptide chain release factor 2 n=1 Tax=Candidatus Zambryskibacteria bacterium CG_4_9_14_3_um_filter_40_16 TaxID=1975111 RepID=A0A2M7WUI8_9BACT|nr:MAG: peptide chain release factor 2 [Candidatus Zambryskibacteria bacterium CG_4_9_14_3_um_filter_40_16]
MDKRNEIEKQIEFLELEMQDPNFWDDKNLAQRKVQELQILKDAFLGVGKYDKGGAVMTIFSGAGGDDAEDFSAILLNMYLKYIQKQNWKYYLIHENKNDRGGYRNITIEIQGKNVYGTLKNESGVHRLVRISPFNAKKLRHTSFSMVEVIPKFEKLSEIDIPEDDIRVEFTKSSGPGGQNVNKRETAVRVVHIPTNMAVHVESERSQVQNREKAIQILTGKIYKKLEEENTAREKGMQISKSTQIEWGNQIRSYVMHPYKMVKDHRTGVEMSNIDTVLEGGIDEFIEAERAL